MKHRMLCVVMLLMLMFSLSACGGIKVGDESKYITNTKQGAELEIVEADKTSATYRIFNETGNSILVGNGDILEIEVERDGTWRQIELSEADKQKQTVSEPLLIGDGGYYSMQASWKDTYGSLPKGHYRMIKGFFIEYPTNSFVLSADFDID